MAYLYKHTPLETELPRQPDLPGARRRTRRSPAPQRLDLAAMLRHFLDFRFETSSRRRFEFELAELERRIHILEGFENIFDALDEVIRIIRKSRRQGRRRREADEALQARRGADRRHPRAQAVQAGPAGDPRSSRTSWTRSAAEAKEIRGDPRRQARSCWTVVRDELAEVDAKLRRQAPHQDRRRRRRRAEFDAEAFIVDEDATVILTRDGWVKRVREVKDPRPRACARATPCSRSCAGSTKEPMAFFSNLGSCLRPPHPRRARRRRATASRCRSSSSSRRRARGRRRCRSTARGDAPKGDAGRRGHASRASACASRSRPHRELSTRAGRRFAKPADGDEVVGVAAAPATRTSSAS